jgi:hypothetical protein
MLLKFAAFDNHNNEVVHDYGLVYEHEKFTNFERLKIAASTNAIEVLRQLSWCLPTPYFSLYVLIVGRGGEQQGRYQSPPLDTATELTSFLQTFDRLFTSDGRHNLWIGSASNSGMLVYDRHDVIYAYGPLAEYQEVLETLNYRNQSFSFPVPHIHHYHEENDGEVQQLLNFWDWQWFPLAASDEE